METIVISDDDDITQPSQGSIDFGLEQSNKKHKNVIDSDDSVDFQLQSQPTNSQLSSNDEKPQKSTRRLIKRKELKRKLDNLAKKRSLHKTSSSSDEEVKKKRKTRRTNPFVVGNRNHEISSYPTSSSDEDSLDDFIVSDTEPIYSQEPLSSPPLEKLPSEFRAKTFKPKEAFSVYVQYLASCLVDKDFQECIGSTKNEGIYQPTLLMY